MQQIADALAADQPLPEPQVQSDVGVTYAAKLSAADRHVDWQRSASQIQCQIRGLNGRMPARAVLNDTGVQHIAASASAEQPGKSDAVAPGTILDLTKRSLDIQCAPGVLHITDLKIESGRGAIINAAAARNG